MAVMISGASIMDGALLLISATEKCPQPQTREHLAALQIAGIKNIVIVQNKIDLVSQERAMESNELSGGIIGGSIVEGSFSVGDKIMIAPGRRIKDGNKTRWEPLETYIESIKGGGVDLDTAHAGGLCGIATPLDPVATKADELSGQVMAKKGELPPIWESLELELELLEKMVAGGDGGSDPVRPLSMNEMIMINSATATSVGTVAKKGKVSRISLRLPICAKVGSRITLSRRVGTRWRLIGHGTIVG